MLYLTIVQIQYCPTVGYLMSTALQSKEMKRPWNNFIQYSSTLVETEENHKILSPDDRYMSRDLNPGYIEYEA